MLLFDYKLKYLAFIALFLTINTVVNKNSYSKDRIRIDEKAVLKDSYFGNFKQCKIIKKSGNVMLELWAPNHQYRLQSFPKQVYDVLEKDSLLKLNVGYDEIWIAENNDGLTEKEKKKWKGQGQLFKLYWKDNKVQAYSLEGYFVSNPLTGERISPPKHKIITIYDRNYILKHPKEY